MTGLTSAHSFHLTQGVQVGKGGRVPALQAEMKDLQKAAVFLPVPPQDAPGRWGPPERGWLGYQIMTARGRLLTLPPTNSIISKKKKKNLILSTPPSLLTAQG